MIYYGTRLSENISRREPEGYLLCLNVPVARTGSQDYLPEELNLPRGPDLIPVFRPESEVFSPETIASFEGMPVTNDHPPDGVTIENIRTLQKGHAHNVRRGTGEESDLLLADLIITDPVLIDQILDGKREISCGYTYELHEENGQYIQRKIRGNHVAVVDAGRAGARVSIKDHKPERSLFHMKKSLLKKLTRMARDGDPEAVEALAEAVEEIVEAPSTEEVTVIAAAAEPAAETAVEVAPAEEGVTVSVDNDALTAILERLDQLIALLTPAAGDEDPLEAAAEVTAEAIPEELSEVEEVLETVEETAGEPALEAAAEEVAAVVEEVLEETASGVLEPDPASDECEDPENSLINADALRTALMAVRPSLARMKPRERRKACNNIAAHFARQNAADSRRYAALLSSRKPAARNGADLGKRIMAKRNPNYKE